MSIYINIRNWTITGKNLEIERQETITHECEHEQLQEAIIVAFLNIISEKLFLTNIIVRNNIYK